MQVRDQYLAESEKIAMPDSNANREYYINQQSQKIESGELPYGKEKNPMLAKMARKQPYYARNQARICSFFVKGRSDWWIGLVLVDLVPTFWKIEEVFLGYGIRVWEEISGDGFFGDPCRVDDELVVHNQRVLVGVESLLPRSTLGMTGLCGDSSDEDSISMKFLAKSCCSVQYLRWCTS